MKCKMQLKCNLPSSIGPLVPEGYGYERPIEVIEVQEFIKIYLKFPFISDSDNAKTIMLCSKLKSRCDLPNKLQHARPVV